MFRQIHKSIIMNYHELVFIQIVLNLRNVKPFNITDF